MKAEKEKYEHQKCYKTGFWTNRSVVSRFGHKMKFTLKNKVKYYSYGQTRIETHSHTSYPLPLPHFYPHALTSLQLFIWVTLNHATTCDIM